MPVKNATSKITAPAKAKATRKPASAKSTVKSNAVKKAPKPVENAMVDDEIMSPLVMIKLWFDGWRKTFILRGRSSRFELWNFFLLNTILVMIVQLKCSYVMSQRFLRYATASGYSLNKIDSYITLAEIGFYLVVLLPLFPLGSMLIRRMHDIGHLAWDNCLKPVFMSMVVLSTLTYTLDLLVETDYANTVILVQVCFATTLYGLLFYALKFVIMTFFYPGDKGRNVYGDDAFNTPVHEEWALNLCCFWGLLVFTVALLYLIMALV